MEIAVAFTIIAMIGIMFWSVKVSKRLSITVFSFIFLSIAIAIIIWQGFTQQAFRNLAFIALVLFVGWLRISKSIADTVRGRAWLDWMETRSSAVCEMCGTKLSYQQVPKDLRFVMLRRFTCPNCGAESKVILDATTQDNVG